MRQRVKTSLRANAGQYGLRLCSERDIVPSMKHNFTIKAVTTRSPCGRAPLPFGHCPRLPLPFYILQRAVEKLFARVTHIEQAANAVQAALTEA